MIPTSIHQTEKLDSNNYESWKVQIKSILRYNELWGYVNGSIVKNEQNEVAWTQKDEKALDTIILSMNKTQYSQTQYRDVRFHEEINVDTGSDVFTLEQNGSNDESNKTKVIQHPTEEEDEKVTEDDEEGDEEESIPENESTEAVRESSNYKRTRGMPRIQRTGTPENQTWELIDRPKGAKILTSRWVYKIKYNQDGTVDKFKARLVARGNEQKKGMDYDEVFAPVARHDSIRTLLASAVQCKMHIHHMDVVTAYFKENYRTLFTCISQNYLRNLERRRKCANSIDLFTA
ncbi:uncharacterized protein LOC143361962 [Halictus rubicundus]|uniref:uncharacterized protein LOC143361962 n=1 Tax=Halictus rubicundus TaxID=77578 RepID=UPI0040356425